MRPWLGAGSRAPEVTVVRPVAGSMLHVARVQCSAFAQSGDLRRLPQRLRDSEARGTSPCGPVCLYAACAQPTGADPIILMVETYSERADAIQNMAIRGPGGTLHQTHLSTVGVRGEDLIPGSYVRTRWRPTQSIPRAQALCRGSGREWNVNCLCRAAIPIFCS